MVPYFNMYHLLTQVHPSRFDLLPPLQKKLGDGCWASKETFHGGRKYESAHPVLKEYSSMLKYFFLKKNGKNPVIFSCFVTNHQNNQPPWGEVESNTWGPKLAPTCGSNCPTPEPQN